MPDKDPLEHTKMSFAAHLEELRLALIKSIGALLLGTLVGLLFGGQVVDYVQTPLRDALETFYIAQSESAQLQRYQEQSEAGQSVPEDVETAARDLAQEGWVPRDWWFERRELADALGIDELDLPPGEETAGNDLVRLRAYQRLKDDPRLSAVGLSAQEPFMVYLKASLVVGAIFSSPFIFYFVWEFVAAGLYGNEKNRVYTFLPISLGLFFVGAALAFFYVFDFVLNFLFWFNAQMNINPTPRISEWISFVLMLPLGFGISFQLPLVMLFLERIGVFTIEIYLRKWRVAVLVIAVLSMFLTPADPTSMILMGLPLVALYFGGIGLCRYLPRDRKKVEG